MEKIITTQMSFPAGPKYHTKEWDFVADTEISDFTSTASGTAAAIDTASNDAEFGSIDVTCGTDDNGYAQVLVENETIYLREGKEILVEFVFTTGAEVTQNELYFGLVGGSNPTSPITDASNANPGSDYFLAYSADGGVTLDLIRAKNASAFDTTANGYTAVAGSVNIAASTSYKVGIRIVPSKTDSSMLDALEMYVNGTLSASAYNVTADVNDGELMAVVFGNKAGAASSSSTHVLDYVMFSVER